MTDVWPEFLNDAAAARLNDARRLARGLDHTELDPAHIVLTLCSGDGSWAFQDLVPAGDMELRICYDLGRRSPRGGMTETVSQSLQLALHLAARNAARSGRDQVSDADVLTATWLGPGEHQRVLIKYRTAVLPLVRSFSQEATALDRLRIRSRSAHMAFAANLRRALGPMGRSPLGFVWRLLATLVRGLAAFLKRFSTPAAFALLIPGIVVREGSRVVVSRMCGTHRRGRRFFWSLGTEYDVTPLPSAPAHAAILLVPGFVAIAVGVAWLLPLIADRDLYGVSIMPGLTRSIGEFGAVEDSSIIATALAGNGTGLWIALACLFVALPPYAAVQQARWELAVSGQFGGALSALLLPLQAFTRITAPIDAFVGFIGLPTVVGSGLLTVLIGMLTAEPLARLVFGY